jgi:hypothetical protein
VFIIYFYFLYWLEGVFVLEMEFSKVFKIFLYEKQDEILGVRSPKIMLLIKRIWYIKNMKKHKNKKWEFWPKIYIFSSEF